MSSDVREFPSVITPDNVVIIGDKVMQQSTQPMEVAPTVEMKSVAEVKPLTVKDVISRLLEVDIQAWKALPSSVREMLMECPTHFEFVKGLDVLPDIKYHGVVLRWAYNSGWYLFRIER